MSAIHDRSLADRWISHLMLAAVEPGSRKADDLSANAGTTSTRKRRVQHGLKNPAHGSTSGGAETTATISRTSDVDASTASGEKGQTVEQLDVASDAKQLVADILAMRAPGHVPKLPPRPVRARARRCQPRAEADFVLATTLA